MDAMKADESGDPELGGLLDSLSAKLQPGPEHELSLLRVGTHIVVRSRDPDLILRVDCLAHEAVTVEAWNAVLQRLAAAHLPIVPPLRREVLWLSESCYATLWPLGDPANSQVSLGLLLGQLHDSTVDKLGLPEWTPLSARQKIHDRLDRAGSVLPSDIAAELRRRTEAVFERSLDFGERVIAHGDAHMGNVVILAGRPAFVDLDDLTLGPRELDLAPSVVTGRRFKGDAWSNRVLEEYGTNRLDPARLDWFCELREVTMNSWLATLWNHRPEARAELVHRVATWEGGGRWHPM